MKIYDGTITEISPLDPYKSGHHKRIVTLQEDTKETTFIEFCGNRMLRLLDSFSAGDRVIIAGANKGSVSQTGTRFNNVIAKTIIKNERACQPVL